MTVFLFFCLFTAIVSFSFGVFCLLKNPRNPTNVTFFANSLANTFWSAGLGLMTVASSQASADFWITIHYTGASMIPPTYALYAYTFLRMARNKRFVLAVWWLIGIAFLALTIFYRDLFISAAPRLPLFSYYTRGGIFYAAYAIWFFLCVGAAVASLIKNLEGRPGVPAKHIWYVLLATAVGFGGGCTAFFPVFDLNVYPFGMAVVFLYPLIMSYAIVKHRLMDIEVIIKRTLVFGGLFAMVMAAVALVTAASQTILAEYFRMNSFLSMGLSGLLILALYEPARRMLVHLTDRFLFQRKFKLSRIVAQASEAIALVRSLKWLSRRIVAFLVTQGRIRNALVYVRSNGNEHFARGAHRGYGRGENLPEKLLPGDPLIRCLYRFQRPIEIYSFQEDGYHPPPADTRREDSETILSFFRAVKAEIIIPSFLRRRMDTPGIAKEGAEETREVALRSVLILGGKKSDEPYSAEELDVFYGLAQESAIAIENARLYDEVVRRQKEAERSREQALEAKRKVEEMEPELVRREKLLFVEQLVKGLAHEIFNPLASMMVRLSEIEVAYLKLFELVEGLKGLGPSEMSKFFLSEFKTVRDGVDAVVLGADHIKRIVETLAQMQQKDDQSVRPFDFKAFWKVAYPLMQMETHSSPARVDVPIESEMPKGLPPILGNPTQLGQVFTNLYRNALHALEGRMDKVIHLKADWDERDPDYLKASFSDNGCGIPEEVLSKIFDFRFTTKGTKGQGIGLSQCKLIIERFFKGTIECESEVDRGTTFILRIPFACPTERKDQLECS